MKSDWVTVAFDGTAGAVISALAAFGAAVLVSRSQGNSDRRLADKRRQNDIEDAEQRIKHDREMARSEAQRQAAIGVLTALNDYESVLMDAYLIANLGDAIRTTVRANQRWNVARILAASVDRDTLQTVIAVIENEPPIHSLNALRNWILTDQLPRIEAANTEVAVKLAAMFAPPETA
jgi:hypothetical protein